MLKPFAFFLFSSLALAAAAEEFTGIVERMKTGELGFENQGRIAYMQNVGTRVSSAVFDDKNDLISKGDVIAKQDTSLCEAAVASAEADMKHAEADLKEKQSEFERSKLLQSKNALSQKQMEQVEDEYNKSLAAREKSAAALRTAKYNLEACFLRAPFDGEVEEQLASEGTWVDQGVPVVKLTVFDVMKVVVEVPEELSRKVSLTNKISVISPIDGKRLHPAWLEDNITDSKTLTIFTKNCKIPAYQLTEKEKALTKVGSISFTIDMNGEDFRKTIWVHEDSLQKDEEGSFVWLAKGQNLEVKENILDRQFVVEKRRVKALNKFKSLGINDYQCIENPGDINLYDIALVSPPKDLKDGERVVYQPCRWLLRQGDKVKVIIE